MAWPAYLILSPSSCTAPLQRTLAVELQRLSIQFRKQQKAYLNRLRSKDGGAGGGGSNLNLLDEGRRGEEEYDPGFSDMQASGLQAGGGAHFRRGEQHGSASRPSSCTTALVGPRVLPVTGSAALRPERRCRRSVRKH